MVVVGGWIACVTLGGTGIAAAERQRGSAGGTCKSALGRRRSADLETAVGGSVVGGSGVGGRAATLAGITPVEQQSAVLGECLRVT